MGSADTGSARGVPASGCGPAPRFTAAWLEPLFLHSSEALFLHDDAGQMLEANPRACALLGYARDDLVQRHIRELTYQFDPSCFEQVKRLLRPDQPSLMQGVFLRRDGSTIKVELRTCRTTLDGRPLILSLARDLTERDEVEAALAHERLLIRTLVDHMPDYIYSKDLSGRFTLVNRALAALFRASHPREVIGRSDWTYYPRELADHFAAEEQRILSTGEPLVGHEETLVDPATHDRRWASTTKLPLRGGSGQIVGLVGISRDITAQKKVEEAQRYLIEAARCLLWEARVIRTPDGRLGWQMWMVNDQAAQHFLPVAVQPGESYVEAWTRARLPGHQRAMDARAQAAILGGQTSYRQEYRIRRADGQVRWLYEDVYVDPIGENHWRAVGVCTDITDRKTEEQTFRHVVSSARCLIWRALIRRGPEGSLDWQVQLADEDAAAQFFPLAVGADQGYAEAWLASRHRELPGGWRVPQAERALAEGQPGYRHEFRCQRGDGQARWLAEDVRLEMLQPDLWQATGVVTDVTDRRLAEQNLRYLLSSARCLIWQAEIEDHAGRLHWRLRMSDNQAAQQFLPLDLEPGQDYADAFSRSRLRDDWLRCNAVSTTALRAGRSGYRNEYRCRRTDGQIRWLLEDVALEQDRPGHWRAIGVCTDITERKVTEDRLKRLIVSARCLLWEATVTDELDPGPNPLQKRRLVWALNMVDDDAAQQFLPIARTANHRYALDWKASKLIEDLATLDERSQEAFRSGRDGYSQEFRVRRADGQVRWLNEDVYIEPLAPHTWLAIGVCTDITDRKHAEQALQINEERFRLTTESTGQLVYDYDLASGSIQWAGSVQRVTGYTPEEFAAMNVQRWAELVHLDDRERAQALLTAARQAGTPFRCEYRFRRKDGSYIHVEDNGSFLRDEGGRPYRMLGAMQDITARRQAEDELRQSEQRFRSLAESANAIPYEFDLQQRRFTYIGPQVEPLLGFPPEAWLEPGFFSRHVHPEDADRVRSYCASANAAGRDHELEYRMLAADGQIVWLRDSVILVHRDGQAVGQKGFLLDVTDSKAHEARLQHLASHDPLTDLANRRTLDAALERVVHRARRGHASSLLLLDLDNFKQVNDTLGHPAGDQLLVQLSRRLRDDLRPEDLVARLGGDEFVALLEDTTGEPALATADRLRRRVAEQPFQLGTQAVSVQLSIGVVHIDGTAPAGQLLALADQALYRAKEHGRNRVAVYTP